MGRSKTGLLGETLTTVRCVAMAVACRIAAGGSMIKKIARACMGTALVAAIGTAAPHLAAQGYPSAPINLVIPLAGGDATDTAARAIAEALSRELKVPMVPQNRPGAAGALGTDVVVKAPKD